MGAYLLDWVLFGIFIIGLTAMMGVISSSFGKFVIGRKKSTVFYDQSVASQKGWRKMTRE